jgi:hypothetical protein
MEPLPHDSFEFIMFHNGKQVDAAVSDPEGHTGGLKMLKGKRRAQAWRDVHGRDFRRAVQAGRQGKLLECWEERLKVPPRLTACFWRTSWAPGARLLLSRPKMRRRSARSWSRARIRPGSRSLSSSAPPPSRLKRRWRPRAWPRYPGMSGRHGAGPAGARLCARLPFYNGQLTLLTSIAEHEWTAPDPGAACPAELTIEIPGFVVPAADPQGRRLRHPHPDRSGDAAPNCDRAAQVGGVLEPSLRATHRAGRDRRMAPGKMHRIP